MLETKSVGSASMIHSQDREIVSGRRYRASDVCWDWVASRSPGSCVVVALLLQWLVGLRKEHKMANKVWVTRCVGGEIVVLAVVGRSSCTTKMPGCGTNDALPGREFVVVNHFVHVYKSVNFCDI